MNFCLLITRKNIRELNLHSLAFGILMFQTCVKNIKMVSCRAPGCRNRADKNSNIIALVTIIMLL